MKITHIKKLCVEAHMCMIYDTDGSRQWIGTQDAIYPADELTLSAGAIKTIFDMPDAEAKMDVGVDEIWRSKLVPCDEEIEVECEGWPELHCMNPLFYNGEKVYPLTRKDGAVLFVRDAYVKPAIRKNDYLAFRMARNRFGHPLIVIGNGTLVTGIARPIPKKGAEALLDLLRKMCEMSAEGSPADQETDRRQAQEPEKADGQIEMVYDIEGGRDRTAADAGGGDGR